MQEPKTTQNQDDELGRRDFLRGIGTAAAAGLPVADAAAVQGQDDMIPPQETGGTQTAPTYQVTLDALDALAEKIGRRMEFQDLVDGSAIFLGNLNKYRFRHEDQLLPKRFVDDVVADDVGRPLYQVLVPAVNLLETGSLEFRLIHLDEGGELPGGEQHALETAYQEVADRHPYEFSVSLEREPVDGELEDIMAVLFGDESVPGEAGEDGLYAERRLNDYFDVSTSEVPVYLTGRDAMNDQDSDGQEVLGYARPRTGVTVVETENEYMEGYLNTLVMEPSHLALLLPHTLAPKGAMSYNPEAAGHFRFADGTDLLIDRLLDGDSEVVEENGTEYVRYTTDTADPGTVRDRVITDFISYIRDMEGYENIDQWDVVENRTVDASTVSDITRTTYDELDSIRLRRPFDDAPTLFMEAFVDDYIQVFSYGPESDQAAQRTVTA